MVAGFNQGVSRVASSSPNDTPFETRSSFLAPLTNGFYASLADGPRTVLGVRSLALTIHRLYSPQASRHRPGILRVKLWPAISNPRVLRVLHMSDTEVSCRKSADACLKYHCDFPPESRAGVHWATGAGGCTLPSLDYRDVQRT